MNFQALGLHGHGYEDGGKKSAHNETMDHSGTDEHDHDHGHKHEAVNSHGALGGEEHEGESKTYIWTMLFVMFFVYLSYMIEFLSRWTFTKVRDDQEVNGTENA